jgi:predicted nucleic-acid-binding Zn-ribbon protein
MKKCPVCGKGSLKEGKVEEKIFGVSLGRFKAEICDGCGESFVGELVMKEIEKRAKKMGLWGLAKKIKVVRSGNSLAIRIPAEIAKFLKLEEGAEILIHPEGKDKLIAEVM